MDSLIPLLLGAWALATPLILAALGGLYSERSGIINIALDGKMLIGAAITAIFTYRTGNPWIGVTAGILGSILLSWLHYLLTQVYHVDHIVSGMGVNALAYGSSNFLSKILIDADLKQPPLISVNLFFMLALLVPLLIYFVVRRTRYGLQLFAVGNDPEKARQMGVSTVRIRLMALTITGVLCGLSGAFIFTNSGQFIDNMTSGRGYIALAALILGRWKPIETLIACAVFALFSALNIFFQGTKVFGLDVPSEFWTMMPYLVTIIALAGFVGKSKAPAGLGKP